MAKGYNGVDIGDKYDKSRLSKESTTVTLNEGDILYHPAGIWHSVESTSDSISINFSMRQLRYADIVVNALRMHLLKDKRFRTGIRFSSTDQNNDEFNALLKSAFKHSSAFLSKLNPQHVIVPAIHIPRSLRIDLDDDNEDMHLRPANLPKLRKN